MDANYDLTTGYEPLSQLLQFFGVTFLADADKAEAGALCVWREAGGEGPIGRRGVAHVIANRAADPSWWGRDWNGVIFRNVQTPSGRRVFQFSCFNGNDVNSTRFPSKLSIAWVQIKQIVNSVLTNDEDITEGAQFYHDTSMGFPAAWGLRDDFKNTLNVGRLCFYRYEPMIQNHDPVQTA